VKRVAEERAPSPAQQPAQAEAEATLERRPDETPAPTAAVMTPEECIAQLKQLRTIAMPMLEAFRERYAGRVRTGYPTLVDNVEHGGVFGINLDPGFGAYFMTDGRSVYAELHRVSLRTDTLSAANYEKFSGSPVQERIDLDLTGDPGTHWVRQSRNLISRLLNAWTSQQTLLFRVDS
jgi:hypothetical protein